MKKLFSIFAAALFATAMSAATVTFEAADFFGTGSAYPGSAISVEKDGVTVSVDKGYGTTAEEKDQGLRVFAGSVLTVSAATNITKIHAEFTEYTSATFEDQEPNATEWSITAGKQIRIKTLEVTLEDVVVVADGFYLLDNSFDWELQYGALLDPNMGTKGEYMVRMNLEPTFDYEMKVVRVEGGEIAQWYPEGEGNNMVPDETGDVTLYFRPEGNTAWPQNFIYVTKAPEHYYLVGDFTDWELDAAYKFQLNAGVGVEEWHLKMELPTAEWLKKENSDIKVIGTIGDPTDKSNWIWFPAGEGNNMTPETYGPVDIYFRPQGNPEWKNVFTYVAEHIAVIEYYLLSDLTDPAWQKQEDKKFVPVEDMEGIFALMTELKEGEHLKGGVFVDGDLYKMLPGSGDEDYWTVDAAHAGDMNIYLSLEFVEDWLIDFPAGQGYLMIEKAPDYILPSQAARLAFEGYTDEATVQGVVTSVAAWSEKYANIDFWLADDLCDGNVFKGFRVPCATAADAPKKGDVVRLVGKVTLYNNTTPEISGGSFEIKEAGRPAEDLGEMKIEEAIAMGNCLDSYTLTGVVANIQMDKDNDKLYNQYGNFDLFGIDGDAGKVFVYGLLTASGEAQKFREMGIDSADTLTIKAVLSKRTEADGSEKIEAVNAIYVSHRKYVAPPQDGFYLVGDRTEWKVDWDLIFAHNAEAEEGVDEYMLRAFLNPEESFKVAKVEGGKIVAYYPEGGEETNMRCKAEGDYMIYFRPEGNKDWELNYVYLEAQTGYYLVGDFNEWKVEPQYWMKRNELAVGEEYMLQLNLPEGTEIKVVGVTPGQDDKWFPSEGVSTNVTPEAYGDVVVYFRPEGGMADWVAGFGYIHVEPEGDEFLTCAQAVELAAAEIEDPTAANATVEGGVVIIRGFVITPFSPVAGAPKKAQLQSAWIADDPDVKQGTVQIFKCEIEQELQKGDLVEVTGTLAKFKKSSGDIVIEVINGSVKVLGGGETIDIVATGCLFSDGTTDDPAWWQIIHYGEDYEVYICFNSDQIAGDFGVADLDLEYSGIYVAATDNEVAIEDADLTVTVSGEIPTIHVVGELLGDDGNIYKVDLTFKTPVPETVVKVTINDAELGDEIADYGDFYFYGQVEQDGHEYFLQVYLDATQIEGLYTGEDMDWSYSGLIVDGAPVEIYSAEFEVEAYAENTYKIFASLICYGDVGYEITLYASNEITGVDNAEVMNEVVKAIRDGQLVIKANGAEFNATGARVK